LEISKMLIAALKNKFIVFYYYCAQQNFIRFASVLGLLDRGP